MAEQHVQVSGGPHKRVVLLAFDESEYSEYAFSFYCESFLNEGDLVHMIHVQEIPTMPVEYYGFSYAEDMQVMHDAATKKGDELVERYKKKCEKRKLNFNISKPIGHPAVEIIEKAKAVNASVILIGTRGQGLFSRTILGSVSDYVVQHSPSLSVLFINEKSRRKGTKKNDNVFEAK